MQDQPSRVLHSKELNLAFLSIIHLRSNSCPPFKDVILITNSISYENKLSQCLTSLVKDKNEAVRIAICKKIVPVI